MALCETIRYSRSFYFAVNNLIIAKNLSISNKKLFFENHGVIIKVGCDPIYHKALQALLNLVTP